MFPIVRRACACVGWGAFAVLFAAGGAAPVRAADGPAVEQITVTARKREENLQDVPLSISALTGQQLQDLGANSDYDVANLTVNFSTVQRIGRELDRPVIRGQSAPSLGGEPNASYFVDGVYVSTTISTATLDIIDRVEILRGPQSAQLGRGTFSGAVNYVTKKPSSDFQASSSARVGSHDDYRVAAWASGPLVGQTLTALASASFSSYGGQWRNTLQPGEATFEPYSLLGSPLGTTIPVVQFKYDTMFARAPQQGDASRIGNEQTADALLKLLFEPVAGTAVTFKYDYTRGDDGPYPSMPFHTLNCYLPTPGAPWYQSQVDSKLGVGMYCGQINSQGLANKINVPDFVYGVPANLLDGSPAPASANAAPAKPGLRRTVQRFTLDLSQDLGDFRLVARGAYDLDDKDSVFDLDHTATRTIAGLFETVDTVHAEDQSYELRLTSPGDLPVRGSLGLYYYKFDSHEQQRAMPGPAVAIPIAAQDPNTPPNAQLGPPLRLETRNAAVFGGVDWDFAERWTLSAEARYGTDTKDLISATLDENGQPVQDHISTSVVTPRFTLRWKPADEYTLYTQVARGNKPAAFNDGFFRSNNAVSGTKDAIRCHTDPQYAQDYLQQNGRKCQSSVVREENAWTYEVGAKTTWLDRRITANLDYFYIDWRDVSVFNIGAVPAAAAGTNTFPILVNDGTARSHGIELETQFVVTENLSLRANYAYTNAKFVDGTDGDYGRTIGAEGDLKGKHLPDSPQHNIVLGANVTRPLSGNREVFLRVDDSYVSRRYTQAGNFNWSGSRNLANLRFGLQHPHWTAAAYVKNLLNDITPQAVLNFVDYGNPYPRDASGATLPALPPGVAAYSPATLFSVNPTRGRDIGVEFQYRY